jgi:hypothetical protein
MIGLAVASGDFAASPLVGLDFQPCSQKLLFACMFDAKTHGGEAILVGAAAAV